MANNPLSSEFTLGVIGTGAMGRGIAQIMALGGINVLMFDAKAVRRKKAVPLPNG